MNFLKSKKLKVHSKISLMMYIFIFFLLKVVNSFFKKKSLKFNKILMHVKKINQSTCFPFFNNGSHFFKNDLFHI
jgi:hypothetical protein